MPPRMPRSREDRVLNAQVPSDGSLPRHPVFGDRQHLIYDLTTGAPEAGYNIHGVGHVSSNTKIAALAFIARLRGVEYLRQNEASLRRMMSLSHNDATIVEVARAMNHPDAARFAASFRALTVGRDGRINRDNDNVVANRMPEETRAFFDAYRLAFIREARATPERGALDITGARINDTSGRAEPGLHHGTTEASPMHIARMVQYLHGLDNGRTLNALSNPSRPPHTAAGYLSGRDQPGNGQLLFAKTGTLVPNEYDRLPPGSNARTQYRSGVYVLTMAYMQDGRPHMAFFRANSDQERRQLATRFLDHVAGVQPQQDAQHRPPRPTTTA